MTRRNIVIAVGLGVMLLLVGAGLALDRVVNEEPTPAEFNAEDLRNSQVEQARADVQIDLGEIHATVRAICAQEGVVQTASESERNDAEAQLANLNREFYIKTSSYDMRWRSRLPAELTAEGLPSTVPPLEELKQDLCDTSR